MDFCSIFKISYRGVNCYCRFEVLVVSFFTEAKGFAGYNLRSTGLAYQ